MTLPSYVRFQRRRKASDELAQMIAFENGELSHEESVALLTSLRDSGLLYSLQGFYGRAARAMGII